MDFLKKHPEIGVLLTDCLSKPDRQVESDGKRPVVNRDPAFYGPQQPHSRADPSISPPAVRPAQEPNEDQASSSAADLQRPSRTRAPPDRLVKVLPWVVDGAGGLGAGKTSGAGTRGVDLNAAIGGRTADSDTNGGESSNNGSKIHVDCYPAENPSL